jgi:hypothetical protein
VKINDIPIASVGAPPVREMRVCSWTFLAKSDSVSGLIVKPSVRTNSEAAPGVPPVAPAGEFIAK